MKPRLIREETWACLACVTLGYLGAGAFGLSWVCFARSADGAASVLIGIGFYLSTLALDELKRFLRAAPLRSPPPPDDDGDGGDDDTQPMSLSPLLPAETERMRCN